MKRILMAVAVAGILPASGGALAAGEPVAVNVEGLQAKAAADVSRYAAEGRQTLVHYLLRTRRIHGLTLEHVTRPEAQPRDALAPRRDYVKHAKDWKLARHGR